MIISTWITKLIAKSNAVFDDVSTDEVREYLNDALILHRRYIRNRLQSIYSKNLQLTLATSGYELPLPVDMDDSVTALVKTSQFTLNPLTSLDYKIQRGDNIWNIYQCFLVQQMYLIELCVQCWHQSSITEVMTL